MRRIRILSGFGVALALTALLIACGGGGGSTPTNPTPTPNPGGGGGGGGTTGTTITITSAGVSPKELRVTPGTRVTFTNNNTLAHDMASDPHPDHTDCPEINQVGFMQPGQSRQTGNLNTVRTCRFHDHNRDTVESLKGSIIISN